MANVGNLKIPHKLFNWLPVSGLWLVYFLSIITGANCGTSVRSAQAQEPVTQASREELGVAAAAFPNYQLADAALAGRIHIHGSQTMRPLMEAWATDFRQLYPAVEFEFRPEGSLLAVASLAERVRMIGATSNPLQDSALHELAEAGVGKVVQIPVARDRIAVIVHPANPLSTISFSQLRQAFGQVPEGTEAVTWRLFNVEESATDRPVRAIGVDDSSGTRSFFAEHVLGAQSEFSPSMQVCKSHSEVIDQVLEQVDAIGFVSSSLLDDTAKILAVTQGDGKPAVDPAADDSQNANYPLERTLYFVVGDDVDYRASVIEREFMLFVLSRQGVNALLRQRFLPVDIETVEASRKLLEQLGQP